jgi:hypothetical protein
MRTSDWDDPEIRAIGRRYAAEAYDLASELHNFGADAAELLRPQPDPRRPRDVTIPVMLADVIMAVFLALPRPEWAPDQPLGENVTALAARRSWAAGAPGASSDSGPSGPGAVGRRTRLVRGITFGSWRRTLGGRWRPGPRQPRQGDETPRRGTGALWLRAAACGRVREYDGYVDASPARHTGWAMERRRARVRLCRY